MRILMVTDWNRGKGGAEAYIAWLKDWLEISGDDVRLLTSSVGSAGDGRADFIAFGTERMIAQAFLQIANPFAMREIRRAISVFRPEVVFVNMFAHHLSPAVLHALGEIPIVLSVSDYKCVCPVGSKLLPDKSICSSQAGWVCCSSGCTSLPHWLRDQPRYALIRSGMSGVRHIIACSDWVRAELKKSGIESERIYLPVPSPGENYSRSPAATPTALYCGRLDVEKGVDVLVRAFAQLSVSNATLRIAGRGPEKERLESLTCELGIEHKVTFLGWLEPSEIEAELSRAWLLAAPSLWAEPLGLVALEALVRRVPVVASAVGGFAETVEHGVTGLLFPNGDVAALQTCLESILSRRLFADGLSDEVVRPVGDRHHIARHVARLKEIFRSVVDPAVTTS